jgi:hypothetical protein
MLARFFNPLSFQVILMGCLVWGTPCSAAVQLEQHEFSYTDFKKCEQKAMIDCHHGSSDSCSHEHHQIAPFRHFGESVTISITMTIPQLSGTVPVGANVDVTPFAIAPNGEIIKGAPTNVVPATALIAPLNGVVIPHPIRGNYVIGYYVTLGSGSPTFPVNTIGNFSGVLLNNPVGHHTQTITFPVQTLFFAPLVLPTDVLTITANFPIVRLF